MPQPETTDTKTETVLDTNTTRPGTLVAGEADVDQDRLALILGNTKVVEVRDIDSENSRKLRLLSKNIRQ